MSQPSVASYFQNRKRATANEASTKNKHCINPSDNHVENELCNTVEKEYQPISLRTRSGRQTKRNVSPAPVDAIELSPRKHGRKDKLRVRQPKIVQYIEKSAKNVKKLPTPQAEKSNTQSTNEHTPSIMENNDNIVCARKNLLNAFSSKNSEANVQHGMKTPTKQLIKDTTPLKKMVRKELNFDEVKAKITRSEKLNELKASLERIGKLEKLRKEQEERNRRLREADLSPLKRPNASVKLKEFDTIEFEVEASPSKLKTPVKIPPSTPEKNPLMSPRHTVTPKRLLFSPSKDGTPGKILQPPAYQRFISLAETSKAGQLPLPYKYRHLLDIFEAVDTVSAMFYNRKETITFKKLRPGVQRLLRKNFTELHLSQIKKVFPEGFIFHIMKTRNYGSISKSDYYQLIIKPNVEQQSRLTTDSAEQDIFAQAQSTDLNPRVLTERRKLFQTRLLDRVKEQHEKFLQSLSPPLTIPKDKVTRWHPDFDLELCSEIELAVLPQPPNVERYSSASAILSTARNLFNCATPMERIMERYEKKLESDLQDSTADSVTKDDNADVSKAEESVVTAPAAATPKPVSSITSNLLKDLPESLLERIRAKQAAKALDAMTRRPSQDQKAIKYSRLPDLARYLRNVFITERKGTLQLELVVKKIGNSFKVCLTPHEIEDHLQLLAKEVPDWLSFHEVRKTMYLKLARDMDMKVVIEKLEIAANKKS